MKIKNLKYILCLLFVGILFYNKLFAFTPTCNTGEIQSEGGSGGCFAYSNDNDWYCSSYENEIGLNLYLDYLDSGTKDLYLSKRQPQADKFSKLLSNYNKSHSDDIIGGAGPAGLQQVGNLNYLMGVYSLEHSDGCKLGKATLDTYFTAELCEKIFVGSEVKETIGISCEDGWKWDTYCCIKSESCSNPATPQTETGTCGSGLQNNGSGCCESICSGDKVYDSSIDNCTGCAEGKIPNGTNTKCVCDSTTACCGIKLNTVVPFIGDCIEMDTDSSRGDTTSVNSMNAFPVLMQGLMKILMSVIMVFSFIMVIVAGLMMTTGAFSNSNFEKGKSMLKNVIISLILLGCSGLILSLINPNFFGG